VRVDPSCDGQLLIIRKIDPRAICFFGPVLEREIESLAQTWLTKIFSRYFYCNILICSYIIAYDSNNVILSTEFFQRMTCLLNLKQNNWTDIVALSDLYFNVILTFWSLTDRINWLLQSKVNSIKCAIDTHLLNESFKARLLQKLGSFLNSFQIASFLRGCAKHEITKTTKLPTIVV